MMTKTQAPALCPFNSDKIPDALKALPRWAPWRAVWNEKRQKYDKIPASAKPPYYGLSTAKPERWHTYDAALAALNANPRVFTGLGYVMTGAHGVVGIDLDNCVQDNTIAPWAQQIITQLGSYTELSPSGHGLRIWVSGAVNNDWTNHEVGIEVYGGNEPRFLTVTGQRLKVSPEALATPDASLLIALEAKYARARTTAAVISLNMPDMLDDLLLPSLDSLPLPSAVVKFLTTGDHGGDRSHALFASAVALYSANLSDDEVFSLLAQNTYAFEVCLDHRRQDSDRALMYLWVEHCQKGKAKSSPVATLADFQDLAVLEPKTPTAGVSIASVAINYVATETTDIADDFDVIDDQNSPIAGVSIASSAIKSVATPKPRFYAEPAGQFAVGAVPSWIIKNVIPAAELMVLYGESGSGKSFMALDLACAIARGLPWRGNKTKQGKVVYVAAEGAGGFRKRLNAYALHHGMQPADLSEHLFVINAAPNFMVKDDALDVCKSVLACGRVAMVIVDTFAQVMPGANENAGEDVGKALQHCKGIYTATGAMVVLVHHAGKDSSKGARGWSGLRAAADAEFEVTKTADGHNLKCTKQKDGDTSAVWGFALPPIEIGVDEDGDVITSCAVVECAVSTNKTKGPEKFSKGWGRRVLEVLSQIATAQTAGIERDAVILEVLAKPPVDAPDDLTSQKRQAKKYLKLVLEDDDSAYELAEDGTISVIN